MARIADRIINFVISLLLIGTVCYAGYALWDTWSVLDSAKSVQRKLLPYKPTEPEDLEASFDQLLRINPDVCAWITIDNTGIDYPVVQGGTNFDYLSMDVYGNYSSGGSIFLDSGNSRSMRDGYSILMGHHMQGGAMFGDVDLFRNEQFFRANYTGSLHAPDRSMRLETVSIIQADAYDRAIYGVPIDTENGKAALISRIEELAIHMRGDPLGMGDQLIALSTCSSDYTNARLLLICRVTGESKAGEGSED